MHFETYEKWVTLSFRWARDERRDLGVPHLVQMLGIEDAELRSVTREALFDERGAAKQDADGVLFLERWQIRAHLWVLGAYELVRSIDERLRNEPELAAPESADLVNRTKHLLARVRVPIAKLEASRRYHGSDYAVAQAGIGPGGLGWKLAEDTIVTQRELSDALMQMFVGLQPGRHNKRLDQTQRPTGAAPDQP